MLGAPEVVGHAEEGTSLTAQREEDGDRFLATRTVGSADGDLIVVLGWASELGGR